MKKLHKGSDLPLYRQLYQIIEQQITDGTLQAGDQLLTEAELSETYGVSRITVRKALELLVEADILVKRQGVGTFIAEKKIHRRIEGIMGFTQNCMMEGKTAGAKLLAAELIDPTIVDIENLCLRPTEKVIRILRLRLSDGIPVMLEENHFSQRYAFLMGEDLTSSIYQMLTLHGISLVHGTSEIDICYADAQTSQLLEVSEGSAMLLTKNLVCNELNEPVHTCKNIINPSRYKMTIVS